MKQNNINPKNQMIENISLLKGTKNPLQIVFVLGDIKELFIGLSETILSSLYAGYSKQEKNEYYQIMKIYKTTKIFEALYNYYLYHDGILKFKHDIDKYFHYAFFYDSSFFYFTLSQKYTFEVIFQLLYIFGCDIHKRNNYYTKTTYLEKKEYLEQLLPGVGGIKYDKDINFIIKFLNYFHHFDFTVVKDTQNTIFPKEIKYMKAITLALFQNKHLYQELYELFLDTFVFDSNIYDEIIDKLEEKKLFLIISSLKNDIISGVNYKIYLDIKTKSYLQKLLLNAQNIHQFSLDDQIQFFLEKEKFLSELSEEKSDFVRIQLKRELLEKKYPTIINLILGIHAIPQDVFYFLKTQEWGLSGENIELYREVKDFILFIDNSYILGFFRPFLLHHISQYFNSSDQKYYVIKFIICLVLTKNYGEYQRISKFFYNLESFYKTDVSSFLSRILQFGWVVILVLFLFFIAPFGIFIAFLIILSKYVIMNALEKLTPELKMSFNFQLTTFASILALSACIFSMSIGYDENISILYKKFQVVVNTIALPSSETIKTLYGDFSSIKANLMEGKSDK